MLDRMQLNAKDTIMTRQDQIAQVLDQLRENSGNDVIGVAAVGMDGIVLVSRMSADVNADRVGAVAATMIGVTRRVSNELRIGLPDEAIIQADKGLFMVIPASDQSLLAVNLRQGANLGMVRLEARDAAEKLNRIL